ncbi:hypothetical protein SGCOL_004297 [Colletotrichum sp. CLE4]
MEAEENPRRQAFRRAVVANINRSTALRQQRHVREQQIQERERQQRQASVSAALLYDVAVTTQNGRTTQAAPDTQAAHIQVVHNQQEVIQPAPVVSSGSSGPSLVGNLEKVAEATPNAALEYPISSWTVLSFDLNCDPIQAKVNQPEIEPQIASSSNSKGKQPQQPRHNINQWLDGRPRPVLDPSADEWLPLSRTMDQDNHPLDGPDILSLYYNSDSIDEHPDWWEDQSKVDPRDVTPVNPLARVPSLDRGPSIRLQRALAEDREAPRKPISDLLGPSEPLPPTTQNGLLRAAEWAGVWCNEVREPSTQAKMAKLGPEKNMSEMELEWSLWHGLEKRPRERPAYLPRLEKNEEEFPSALRRE